MLAPHFSKSILFTATRSLRGTHFAAWTTAVAPYPKRKESCFKHCLILEMQIKTSKLYRWLPEAHIAPFCLAIFLRRQPPFCLATRTVFYSYGVGLSLGDSLLTGWDRRFWLNEKVLGTSLKVNEQRRKLTQAHSMDTMDQCALDLTTKVMLYHTSLTFE